MEKNITVVIAAYEMGGRGLEYLKRNLDSLASQVYESFDVVVSDNSTYFAKDAMQKLCKQYPFVTYVHNPVRGAAGNFNNALRHATGKYVRFLAQDDWLANDKALSKPVSIWNIHGCDDNTEPYWTDDIHHGNNKLGGPSGLTILREKAPEFDETLTWLFDCDMYRRLYDVYGRPRITKGVNYNVGKGEHQLTNTLSDDTKKEEELTLKIRYDNI